MAPRSRLFLRSEEAKPLGAAWYQVRAPVQVLDRTSPTSTGIQHCFRSSILDQSPFLRSKHGCQRHASKLTQGEIFAHFHSQLDQRHLRFAQASRLRTASLHHPCSPVLGRPLPPCHEG